MKEARKILIIGGPSGVGESTITNGIIKKYPIFSRLTTATTRSPRLKERDGADYYFFSIQKFKNEIKKGNIIEHTYVKNRRVYYGSFKPDLEKKLKRGYNIIVNPDIVGAKYYKTNFGAVTIFIKPDSLSSIKKRQLARNPEITTKELNKRLESARNEIKNEAKYYDYIIINKQGRLNDTIKQLINIIKKEKYSLKRNQY
jgi:guanylate kinase